MAISMNALASCASGASALPPSPASTTAPVSPTRYESVPTQFVEANGVRYAYRRFGMGGDIPLVLFAHFRASMDNWDPQLLNNLAVERTVIAFNNKGVSSSGGETPDTVMAMADDSADFIAALGYSKVDVLGFSIGGAVVQELMLLHPTLVRRAVLAGTGPHGAEGLRERPREWAK
ncbi:alpha/beta fold hydrolase [Myxococcus sp. 1LA]